MTTIARNPRLDGARIGLILPSLNTTTEPEFAWIAPAGMSFHAARVFMAQTTAAELRAMNEEVAAASRLIASIAPSVVAYACTGGTFIDGASGLRGIVDTIAAAARCPVVTTSGAMLEALAHLGVRKVALATPYPDDITAAERAFLAQNGLEVVAAAGLGLSGSAICKTSHERIATLVRQADHKSADALFVSCTDFRALELVDALEQELGKPVLTSNQVTLWGVLRALGITPAIRGFGRLLRA